MAFKRHKIEIPNEPKFATWKMIPFRERRNLWENPEFSDNFPMTVRGLCQPSSQQATGGP
jgi:hypothetical protein